MKINFNLKRLFSSKGFTLIELLIVIAILGILAAGILVAINPVDKVNAANDAKVQNDVSGIGRAAEAYATTHNGFYPATRNDLVVSGELRREPVPPTGYGATYTFTTTPAACTAGVTCTRVIVGGQLKSLRFLNAVPSAPAWTYDSLLGESCPEATQTTPADC